MTSIQDRAPGRRTRRNLVLALVAAVVLLCVGAISLSWAGTRRGLVSQLARAKPERSFAPRVSIPTRYHTCTSRVSSQDTVPREKCAEKPDEGRLVLRKFIAAGESAHPDSLQASALAGLIWWDGEDASLDAAIEHLNTALRLSPNSVPLLVDLSAAHLVRAERMQNSRDLLVAVEFAHRALSREPRNEPARFNAALGLQLFGFVVQARLEWDAFLALDSTSRWANEARHRKQQLIRPAPVSSPALSASRAVVDSFARQHPQQAREHGFDRILGEWGSAVQKGDDARADSLLNFAEGLGQVLKQRSGGDLSLVDAVGAIREASRDAAATLVLARAHQAYAEGQALLSGGKPEMAFAPFTRVVEARPRSRVLRQWAVVFQVAMSYYQGRQDAGKRLGVELPRVDSVRYPALAGRARRMLGNMLQRDEQIDDGRAQFADAVPYLVRAGEAESLAHVLSSDAEGAEKLGDTFGAYIAIHRLLRTSRGSSGLHARLMALGRFAEQDELPHAAWAIYNEDIALAARPQPPINEVEVRLARARVRRITGDSLGAAQDIAYAAMWQDSLPLEYEQKDWARAQIRMARPESVSAVQMDSVVEALASNPVWHATALNWSAERRLNASDLEGAAEDLRTITEGVRRLVRQQSDIEFRAAMMEQARRSFDRLVMLHLRNGQVHEALRSLEAGRMSFAPRRESGPRPGEGRLAAPRGQVAVEYTLIGDTLLSWTIGDSIRVWIQPVDRDTFQLTVEQANAALQVANGPLPRQALHKLYDWLIRPIRPHLGSPDTQLVILADGEVARVPFAALMNGSRHLIEDYSLRIASTLEDAARTVPRGNGPVLLVDNPSFDTDRYAMLDRLPGASAEVASIAPRYSNVVRLKESAATRDGFVARMQTASIIHYAGHAVFDDARPERSYLLLAGDGDTGRLTADSISTMRLRGAPLVVLSACSTLRSGDGRSGGFAGLSGALLAAGAGGVVGSLWDVNDQRTQPLMEAFHRHYLKSGNPARALRDAQLDMLRSPNPEERSPAVWAGFRYTGS